MARSLKGAMGLMQLMPSTAVQFGVTNAYDPVQNIRAGVAYLRRLLDRYSHNEELAWRPTVRGTAAVKRSVPSRLIARLATTSRKFAAGPEACRHRRGLQNCQLKDGRETVRYTNVAGQARQ